MKQTFGVLLLALTFMSAQTAKAETYLGGLVGYGVESGNGYDTKGGLALGATAGISLVQNLGVAFTYLHNFEQYNGVDTGVSQFLGELNFFSILFFPSGIHVGSVHTSINFAGGSASGSDLGFGAHTGFDIHLVENVTIGLAGYYTYVTTTDNKHSLIDVVVPVKFHF